MDENQLAAKLAAEYWYIPIIGACLFGTVVGWLAHNVFQRAELLNVSWLASMVGVIGGGAVTAIFRPNSLMFGAYCIGLSFAFFVRVVIHPISKAIADEMELERLKEIKRQERAEARRQEALENKGTP